MCAVRLTRTALVTFIALVAAPLGAVPAHAAEATVTGVALDTAGKPLPNVHWDIQSYTNGEWTSPLQFGPRLTDAKGQFTWSMPLKGQYRVCFADTYYDRADTASGYWQPEVRHRDTCWPNATSVQGAQTWSPTASAPKKTFTVKMPQQGLGMAPVEPFITGTYEVGKPLTVVGQEGWRPTDATFSYRWMERSTGAATPIAGATSATFTPGAAQNGKWVWAQVTASRTGYKPATMTTPLTRVGGTHVQISSPLRVSGTVSPGNTITASYGKPGNTYGAIQWFVDGVPTPDGPSYDTASWPFTVTAAHAGARVEARLSIYRTDAQGNYVDGSDSFHRAQVTVAGQRPAQALPTAPAPSGTATVGKVLAAPKNVTADPAAALSYQWYSGSAPVSGATRSTYTVRSADLGKPVQVRVSVARPGWWGTYVTTSRSSVAKGALKKGKVTIKGATHGKARVGKKLSAKATGWGPKPVKVSYRWLRNGKSIKGATKSTYTVSRKDRGNSVKVKIAVRKSKYATVTKTSKNVKIKR